MANFTNFTKLQLIVERTPTGDDGELGGDLVETITFTGTATASGTFTVLGQGTAITIGDTSDVVAGLVATTLDGLVGVTAVAVGSVVTATYTSLATDPVVTTPVVNLGVTAVIVEEDNRDGIPFTMKHSEYEDSETGLQLATEAMYTLVAASPESDSIQMQRIKLSDSDAVLVTDDITLQVLGKNYSPYTVV